MRIKPSGHGVDMVKFGRDNYNHQQETLLNRGSSFRITGITQRSGKPPIVDVERV